MQNRSLEVPWGLPPDPSRSTGQNFCTPGCTILSSIGLGFGNLIGRAQRLSVPALDKNRRPIVGNARKDMDSQILSSPKKAENKSESDQFLCVLENVDTFGHSNPSENTAFDPEHWKPMSEPMAKPAQTASPVMLGNPRFCGICTGILGGKWKSLMFSHGLM